jgi:DNA-binding CsgD family transcriptional regulator
MDDVDVDALMATATELAAPRSVDRLRHDAVALLPRLVPCTLIAWNDVDLSDGSINVVMEPDRAWPEGHAAWATYVGEHPVIAHFQATNDGRPYTISDFLDVDQFHRTGIYQHFYRRLEAEDQLSFVLPHPQLVVGIAFNRAQRDFSQRDRQVANLLRPVIVQAYRNAVAYDRSRLLLDQMNLRLDVDGEGLVVCDRQGHIVERTPGAEALLERWFGHLSGTALPSEVTEWLNNPGGRAGPPWPMVLHRGTDRLVARLLPGPDGAMVTLLLTEAPTGRAREGLLRIGLTGRQTDVVAVMAEGASNAEIAERLGISHRTVDKHLQRAFDKLGVENRTSAANLVHQLERQD